MKKIRCPFSRVTLFLCLFLLMNSIFLTACSDSYYATIGWYGHMPTSQVGSTWRAEDGKVEFTIISTTIPEHTISINGSESIVKGGEWIHGEGYILLETGERLNIIYSDGRGGIIDIRGTTEDEEMVTGPLYESWWATEITESSFVAIVNKSILYEPGQRILFNKILGLDDIH